MERGRYSWNSEGKEEQIWGVSKCKHFDVLLAVTHEWVSQMTKLWKEGDILGIRKEKKSRYGELQSVNILTFCLQ
jgi:hypothetical protein